MGPPEEEREREREREDKGGAEARMLLRFLLSPQSRDGGVIDLKVSSGGSDLSGMSCPSVLESGLLSVSVLVSGLTQSRR